MDQPLYDTALTVIRQSLENAKARGGFVSRDCLLDLDDLADSHDLLHDLLDKAEREARQQKAHAEAAEAKLAAVAAVLPSTELVAALRALEQCATPGPWEMHEDSRPSIVCREGLESGYWGGGHLFHFDKYGIPWGDKWNNYDDGNFIVAARTEVPTLLDSIDTVRAVLQGDEEV